MLFLAATARNSFKAAKQRRVRLRLATGLRITLDHHKVPQSSIRIPMSCTTKCADIALTCSSGLTSSSACPSWFEGFRWQMPFGLAFCESLPRRWQHQSINQSSGNHGFAYRSLKHGQFQTIPTERLRAFLQSLRLETTGIIQQFGGSLSQKTEHQVGLTNLPTRTSFFNDHLGHLRFMGSHVRLPLDLNLPLQTRAGTGPVDLPG